ncbi:hypothetical protein C8J56DRAFT_916999 [Mycena floridula]|nr:hypothetical protein C8J56DRAFT_916999 [Mycena floridula]
MAKRKYSEEPDLSDEEDFSDSEIEEDVPSGFAKKVTKPRKAKEAKLKSKAEVVILATDSPANHGDLQDRLSKIEEKIVVRIKKALSLAHHANTGEDEARAALRMASKLLEKHNVTQAEIMSHENDEEKLKRAGMSNVKIQDTAPKASNRHYKLEGWVNTLAHAMSEFFDCQHFNTAYGGQTPRVVFSFYGLAEQTVAAVYAFEMAYNLVLAWSMANKAAKGRHGKNSYRVGVASGLYDLAKKDKKQELEKAIEREKVLMIERKQQEDEEEKRRIERLEAPKMDVEDSYKVKMEEVEDDDMIPSGCPVKQEPQSDDESDNDDSPLDFDNSDNQFVKADFKDDDPDDLLDLDAEHPRVKSRPHSPSPPPAAPEPQSDDDEDDTKQWSSLQQLTAFRESTVAIGDDFLKSKKIKLHKGKKRPGLKLKDAEARAAYIQGKEDAKNIDVKRRRIKGPEEN